METVEGRDDLSLSVLHSQIQGGRSQEIVFDVPERAASLLLEVKGGHGAYAPASLLSPSGHDLVTYGRWVTEYSREVPGLVDWMLHNDPSEDLEPGTYSLTISAEDVSDEGIEVRVYAKDETPTCGIYLDFLVDPDALDEATYELALDQVVVRMQEIFAQVGISILSPYQIARIELLQHDIAIAQISETLANVDDALAQNRRLGSAREGSLHVMVVRSIGGPEPAGYSMGLPGPYDADRPVAAVLVSTSSWAAVDGTLDVDGWATTVSHEIGHYLGLYHTGESFEPISDTPDAYGNGYEINIMTPTGETNGRRRTVFTPGQGRILRRHPLCYPADAPMPTTCSRQCSAPDVCSFVGGVEDCREACDPMAATPCSTGLCQPDDLGTYVCD